jgi:hypothetical protein
LNIYPAIIILDFSRVFSISRPFPPINQEYLSGFSESPRLNDLYRRVAHTQGGAV